MILRVLVAVALLCSVARAQGEKPWAAGVSAENQKEALALYDQANELFEKGNYLEALPIYEKALVAWDHPGIHYNTVVCLINLDRSVEAYEHLQKALAYGEAPLGKDLYTQGQTYQRMLSKQVAMLEVTLTTPGATVQLDGKPLLDGAGTAKRTVLATEHRVVVEKPGYKTENRKIVLEPGKTTTLVLEMKLEARGRTERRWARWKPWIVVGASGVLGLAGAFVVTTSQDLFGRYDAEFQLVCPDGCEATSPEAESVEGIKHDAESRQRLGYGIVAAGGATLVAGLVLVVLNQPRLVGATVTPTASSEHAGVLVSIPW